MTEEIPEMLFGIGFEDEKAIQEVLKAKVPCKFVGPLEDEQTPQLIHGSVRFYGLEGVRGFIEGWNAKNKTK